MRRMFLLAAVVWGLLASSVSAQVFVYDAVSDIASATTTGTNPHTYTGQAFSMSNAGGPTPQVTQMRIGLFVIGAQNFPFSQGRVQFWGTYDPTATGTNTVFSNPIGAPLVFNSGAISTTGNAVFIYTVNFGTPVSFPAITNLGVGVNWQQSADGTTFNDSDSLVTAMRIPGNAPIPVGMNVTVGGVFFRNNSMLTNFNFQAADARAFTGSTNATDGLVLQLSATPIPEPTSLALVGLIGAAGFGWRRRNRKS